MGPVSCLGRVVIAAFAVVLAFGPVTAGAEGPSGQAQLMLWLLGFKLAHEPLRMDVNSATVAELSDVPGIQRRLALRIIAQRPYATLQDLSRAGLSPGAIDRVGAFLTVDVVSSPSALPATAARVLPR